MARISLEHIDKTYPNGYIAWDGSSAHGYVWDETAWGTLYLSP